MYLHAQSASFDRKSHASIERKENAPNDIFAELESQILIPMNHRAIQEVKYKAAYKSLVTCRPLHLNKR